MIASIAKAKQLAVSSRRIAYVYYDEHAGYSVSNEYMPSKNKIYKTYPGGRSILYPASLTPEQRRAVLDFVEEITK